MKKKSWAMMRTLALLGALALSIFGAYIWLVVSREDVDVDARVPVGVGFYWAVLIAASLVGAVLLLALSAYAHYRLSRGTSYPSS